MTEQEKLRIKKQLEGWFATSFWVDAHYALAVIGTLIVFVRFAIWQGFDVGFSSFVGGMWITAVGNDKVNMPPSGG